MLECHFWANVMLRQSRLWASRASPAQKLQGLRLVFSKNFSRATFFVFWVTYIVGRCMFELNAGETNLMKKRSVSYRESGNSQCQFTILGTRSCDINLAFLSLTSWTTCTIFIRCLLGKGKNWLTYSILEMLGETLEVITWIIAQLIWINLPCKSISLEDLLQMPCFLLGDNETTLFCNFGTCYCKYFWTFVLI